MIARRVVLALIALLVPACATHPTPRADSEACMTVDTLYAFYPFQMTVEPYYQAVFSRVDGAGRDDGWYWVILRFGVPSPLTRNTEGGLVLRESEFTRGAQFRFPKSMKVVDCSRFVPVVNPRYRCLEVWLEELRPGC